MENKGLAIITGASQGIGAVIAKGLAHDGFQVVLIARNIKKLEKVRDEILQSHTQENHEPIILPMDITDNIKVDSEIRKINESFGKIDILVNAAAMFMDGSLSEAIDEYRKIMEINVIAQYGFPNGGIYGSTKFAFLGLAESLYRELAPLGIRVTSLCPGWVNTDMAKQAGTPFMDDEMVQPDDILNTIRYLLNLSPNVCIKDIVFEMKKSII